MDFHPFFSLGRANSDEASQGLSREFLHHQNRRVGAYVMKDFLPDWMTTNVYVYSNKTTRQQYEEIILAQKTICTDKPFVIR
jgi:hypothetical protein